ncbi:hypothetical protein [Microbispora amethystogenes]|uniref:Uncharacterized protein n=1 Tax=Microbispora amethystogenes TaxID=1427754 RepID=A0ABQ4FMZ9_9ACTN|nr:hypothetical protein [Microbispora amethystogenes]GIH36172.1 hypothetical protein Mam01_63360 [Microbispora amethystogenes]
MTAPDATAPNATAPDATGPNAIAPLAAGPNATVREPAGGARVRTGVVVPRPPAFRR